MKLNTASPLPLYVATDPTVAEMLEASLKIVNRIRHLTVKSSVKHGFLYLIKNNTEFPMSAPLAKASLSQTANRRKTLLRWLAVLTLIYLLLVGIGVISM